MATVSKNIFWSTLTSLLQLYTGSVVFIVLAKLMTLEDFGVLSFGFSLSAIAVIVADFGFSLMIMKDYPRQLDSTSYISRSMGAKIILALVSSLLFLGYLYFFYSGEWLLIGSIYVAFAFFASFTIYLQALLRVQNKFNKYTETGIIYAVAVTLAVIAYWYLEFSLVGLVLLLLVCKVLQLLWAYFCCRDSLIGISTKSKGVLGLIKNSWSFGIFGILGIFYFMIDTQLISIYLSAKEVALYQSVFRIVLILMVFSDIVSNVLLPFLSFKFFNKDNVSELVSKIFLYLLIIGCSWFLLFTSFKVEILEILYTPEYKEAAILVLPFSIVIVLRTVATLLGNILTISDRQAARVLTVSISLVISLVLNIVLIPKYGIHASAWVSVVVHIGLFGMYWIFSKKEVRSIKLVSVSSSLIILLTAAIYLTVNQFTESKFFVIFGCAFLWLFSVALIMKQNNNLGYLQMILKEKGVG